MIDAELKGGDPRRALIQRNPQNDIGGVLLVTLVILSPPCILIAPLVTENTHSSLFSDTEYRFLCAKICL